MPVNKTTTPKQQLALQHKDEPFSIAFIALFCRSFSLFGVRVLHSGIEFSSTTLPHVLSVTRNRPRSRYIWEMSAPAPFPSTFPALYLHLTTHLSQNTSLSYTTSMSKSAVNPMRKLQASETATWVESSQSEAYGSLGRREQSTANTLLMITAHISTDIH